ncbi:MAG: helix-turn-helix transcriptional regulator [Planctomycetales bacterium]
MKTIDLLFEESGATIDDIADRTGLAVERIEAIAVGRWTPNPKERENVAAAFGTSIDQISWGHTMDPRNIRYRQFGLKGNF